MSGELCLRNHQRTRSVDMRQLRWITRHLLGELMELEDFDLTVQLVGAAKMTQLNETHLQHAGSTDVITFDYAVASPQIRSAGPRPAAAAIIHQSTFANSPPLAGEIFVCVDEAVLQARKFRTTWQAELVRYIVHGVLHLQGYDDLKPAARRLMKREEGRRLGQLAREFNLSKLQGKTRVAA